MALGFVHIQHLSGFPGQRGINLRQAFRNILMYGRLTDAELFCGLAHSGIVINNIVGNIDCSLLDIIFHGFPPENLFYNVCGYEIQYVNFQDAKIKTDFRLSFLPFLIGGFPCFPCKRADGISRTLCIFLSIFQEKYKCSLLACSSRIRILLQTGTFLY